MIFPYGEWVILFLALVTWVEKRASSRFFLMLAFTWLIGKVAETVFPSSMPWHWHFARLAVMLFLWIWALQRTERKIIPFIFTSFFLSIETLFMVNDPGVIPFGQWPFMVALLIVARLTAKSYWGVVAAFTGGLLFNQIFVRFTYEGIVRHMDFPDAFVWNFGVGAFVIWAALRQGWEYYLARARQKEEPEQLLTVSGAGYEHPEE